jgi:Phage tail tube protein
MTIQAQADSAREDISYCFEGPFGVIPAAGTKAITNATNANPIVITSAAHGYQSGQSLDVAGVLGNTNANGRWDIAVIDANSYSLVGSQGNAAYTSGGTSAVAVHSIRRTSDTPKYNVQKQRSKEFRSDRKSTGLIVVSADADLSIAAELSAREYDYILAALLQSQWVAYGHRGQGAPFTGTFAGNTLTAGAAPTGASAFTTLKRGQWVTVKGSSIAANNDRVVQVSRSVAPTTTVVTFEGTPFTAGAGGAGCFLTGARLQEGSLQRGMDFERAYRDIGQFQAFRGMMLDSAQMQFQQGNILSLSLTLIGKDGLPMSVTTALPAAPAASSTLEVMNAVTGITNIQQDGAVLTKSLMQVSLQIANNMRKRMAIGSTGPIGIGNGEIVVSGSMEAYLEDGLRYTAYVNNTPFALSFAMTDLAGNGYVITMPRCRFSDANPGAAQENSDIMDPGAFECEADLLNADPQLQATILIDRVGVTL